MEVNYSKEQMVNRARELKLTGNTWKQIADTLAREGYRNRQGKSYTEGGVHTIVSFSHPDIAHRKATVDYLKKRDTRRNDTTEIVSVKVSNGTENKVLANRDKTINELSKSILNLRGVDNEQKLDLLSRVFEL